MTIMFSVTVAVALGWVVLAVLCLDRSRSSRWIRPTDRPTGSDAPTVAAVVPARNEQEHIGGTIESLMAQDYPHLTILVVDDQSVDTTAEIVHRTASDSDLDRNPVRLLPGVERPGGWVGKTWALHQGVEATDSEWIWMVDADLRLHPKALATAIEAAREDHADFVSFLGRPHCETFWQGSIALTLVQILSLLYPLKRVNDPARAEALAHGAFVLIRRATYERVGGITCVRGEIVEDIRFASRVKAGGGRLRVAAAPELSQTHMYGSFDAIWRGLRKNAFAGMDYRLHKFVTGVILGLGMTWGPVLAIGVGLTGGATALSVGPAWWLWLIVGLLGWSAQAAAAFPVVVFLALPGRFAFALPAGLAAYVAITTASVWHFLRGRVLWKDRQFSTASIKGESIGNQ